LSVLLPLTELALAVMLLPRASAWWGAVGALVLFLLFMAGIGFNLARGRTPNCHCFGRLHSAPLGPSTLLRTLVLALLAGGIVWFGRSQQALSAVAWTSRLTGMELLSLLGFLVLFVWLIGAGWLLWQVLSQQGRLLLRLEAVEARWDSGAKGCALQRSTWPGGALL